MGYPAYVLATLHGKWFCVCVCVCALSFLTLCDSMGLPGSSVHGIFPGGILDWVAISSSRRSSQPRDRTCVSCIAVGFLTAELPGKASQQSHGPSKSSEKNPLSPPSFCWLSAVLAVLWFIALWFQSMSVLTWHSFFFQLYVYIYILFRLFSIIDYYKILNITPCKK